MRELQAQRQGLNTKEKVGLGERGHFDTEIYENTPMRYQGYVTSIASTDEPEVTLYAVILI